MNSPKRYKNIIHHLSKATAPKAYMKMPQRDMYQGMANLSGNGYKFLTYLYTLPEQSVFDPEEVMRVLNASRRTVGAVFKELQIKGFLLVEHNKTHDLYVLGLQKVEEFKKLHGGAYE